MKNQNITPHTQFIFRFNQNNLRIENLNASYSYTYMIYYYHVYYREKTIFGPEEKKKKRAHMLPNQYLI